MFSFIKKQGSNPKKAHQIFTNEIMEISELLEKNQYSNDKYFNKLLVFLTDPVPENRIAACMALGKTSKDVAFTHLSHWLRSETDENVRKAMKTAMSDIRKNMARDCIEKE